MSSKAKCKYWEKCYRKDKIHQNEFLHPGDEKENKKEEKESKKEEKGKKNIYCFRPEFFY